MDAERERLLMEGLRAGSAKANAAKQRFRQKLVTNRPWRALAEEWRDEMWRVFGKDVAVSPWRKKEEMLARKLLDQVGYEMAEKMVHLFIRSWKPRNEKGLPTFSFLWVRRDSVLAEVKGQANLGRRLGEFDPEKARKHPKIGWA